MNLVADDIDVELLCIISSKKLAKFIGISLSMS